MRVLHKPLTIHRGKKNIITSAENINSLEAWKIKDHEIWKDFDVKWLIKGATWLLLSYFQFVAQMGTPVLARQFENVLLLLLQAFTND